MSRRKKPRHDGEYNFWHPAADLMTGLVFILMLLVALLGLYLLYTPSLYYSEEPAVESLADDEEGDTWETEPYEEQESAGVDDEEGDDEGDGEDDEDGGGSGYGPGDEGIKSAVFAEVIDGETEQIIKAENVEFELYEANGALQVLYTYYPERISYRKFGTTEEGVFYLPEKIWQGGYYFHGLTAPEGYDPAADQYFEITELYDWPQPYLVRIPMFPSKNVIRLQMYDQETGMTVGGGTFQVIAAEDIRTLDGTLRFKSGQTAGTIVCDANGYGESQELYLGNYILKQEGIPACYGSVQEETEAVVSKKTDAAVEPYEIETMKTRIQVTLADELYPEQGISDAEFLVTKEGDNSFAETVYTDSQGSFTLTDLDKNAVYHIRQKTAPGNYRADTAEYDAAVSADGRIDGQIQTELKLTNRMLRVNINAVDAVLRNGAPDVKLELYDSADTLINSWQTDGSSLLFTDLAEGSYYVVKNGDREKPYELQVTDSKEIQELNVPVITWMGAAAAAGAAAGLILFILLITFFVKLLIRNRRKKKDRDKTSE